MILDCNDLPNNYKFDSMNDSYPDVYLYSPQINGEQ